MRTLRVFFVALLSFLVCGFANATISAPVIVPTSATVLDFLRVNVSTAFCDTFTTLGPTDRVLEVSQNVVRMTVLGFSTTDFAQCNNPAFNYTYDIGLLPSGNYRFELYRRFVLDPDRINLVGTANFSVAGVAPAVVTPVPAFSTYGIFAFAGLILLVTIRNFRKLG